MPLRFSLGAENTHEVMLLPLESDEPGSAPVLLVGTSAIAATGWQNAAIRNFGHRRAFVS
jgi:hypothetical protein